MVYKWNGFQYPVKAEIVGREFEKIEQKEGELSPSSIVTAAKSKNSVLHPLFEWDDKIAAQAHREEQARHLICALIVSENPEKEDLTIRAFVNVSGARQKGKYINIKSAMESEETRKVVLGAALNELIRFQHKYKTYSEFTKIFEDIDDLKDRLEET